MGNGLRLKKLIEDNNTNIRRVAMATGISPTTLYSIINKDSNIRLDMALLLSDELHVDIGEICDEKDLIEGAYLNGKDIPENINSEVVKRYLRNRIEPLVSLYGEEKLHQMDVVLRGFYQLDDVARDDVLKIVKVLTDNHSEDKRVEELKGIRKKK